MKPPSFHINKLHNYHINWNKKRIENLVYKLQEEKYPNNNIFIKNFTNIEINLGNIYENKDEHLIF